MKTKAQGLEVKDVQDGAVVKGPDPDRIVIQYKTVIEGEDVKTVEETVSIQIDDAGVVKP